MLFRVKKHEEDNRVSLEDGSRELMATAMSVGGFYYKHKIGEIVRVEKIQDEYLIVSTALPPTISNDHEQGDIVLFNDSTKIKINANGSLNLEIEPPIIEDEEEKPESKTIIDISSDGQMTIECIGDDTPSNINLISDNLNITAQTEDQSGSVNIITDNANVTAENIALNGTTNLNGDLTVSGAVKGATIESDANNLDDTQDQLDQHEIEYAAHMHTGNMGSPTSPPL